MRQALQKRWFLIMLVVIIPSGLTVGAQYPKDQVERLIGYINPSVITALVLFLMSFSLDSRQLKSSFRSPGPVLWASLVNYGLIPLLAWPLMSLQLSQDFELGLMIAASLPCTMAAASVWTRKAGGNDAVSLLVTTLTNGLCFLLTPLWLGLTTTTQVELPVDSMIVRLLWAVLVPSAAGQIMRYVPGPRRIARNYKVPIGVVAQLFVLLIVLSASCKAGTELHRLGPETSLPGLMLVWGSCIALHLVAMGIGVGGAGKFGFRRDDLKSVAFASSQKTLPIGVLIATDQTMFGNPNLLGTGVGVPFAMFPILLYHASQLFIDTVVADRFAAETTETADSTQKPPAPPQNNTAN